MDFKLQPLLSVIVPVYNVPEESLRKCLESILSQHYVNIELLLVDDGSINSIADCCNNYGSKDARVRVVHKENGGVSSARNMGLALASGDYVTFIDSDDWIEANYLLEGMQYILHTQTDVVFLGTKIEMDGEIQRSPFVLSKAFVMSGIEAKHCLMKRELVGWGVASKIFRRAVLTDIHFDATISMAEDLDFCWRVLTHVKRVAYFPAMGYHYCHRKDSATHVIAPEKRITGVKVFYRILQNLDDESLRYIVQIRYLKEMASCLVSIYRDNGSSYSREIASYRKLLRKNMFLFIQTPYYGFKIKSAVLLLAILPRWIFRFIVR